MLISLPNANFLDLSSQSPGCQLLHLLTSTSWDIEPAADHESLRGPLYLYAFMKYSKSCSFSAYGYSTTIEQNGLAYKYTQGTGLLNPRFAALSSGSNARSVCQNTLLPDHPRPVVRQLIVTMTRPDQPGQLKYFPPFGTNLVHDFHL